MDRGVKGSTFSVATANGTVGGGLNRQSESGNFAMLATLAFRFHSNYISSHSIMVRIFVCCIW